MSKLAIGAGLAIGAENFYKAYMQGMMYKQQQKMMKNQVILQALNRQLEDDNIPYAERAKILDSIPNLLGAKLDAPLSQMMGLQDLLDDDVEIQKGIEATPAKPGTPKTILTDPTAIEQGLAGSITQEATQDVPEGIGREGITQKFGDMSPAKYKQLITNRQQDIDSERALEQYRRKAEIDFELQKDSYKAQGYNKVITEGFNADGEYVVLMGNQSNDIKEVKMPKGFQPTKILTKSGSKLPSMVVARTAYYQNEINPTTGQPYTSQEAQELALRDYKEFGDKMFEVGVKGKETSTESAELRNKGEMPRTRAEIEADKDRDEAREDRRANLLSAQEGIIRDANSNLVGVKDNLSSAEAAYSQAIAARDAWIKSNGTPEGEEGLLSGVLGKTDHSRDAKFVVDGKVYYIDPSDLADEEYKTLNAELSRTRAETNKWRSEQSRLLGDIKSAESRISSMNTKSTGSSSSSKYSPADTLAIETIRKAYPDKVKNMSDDDILNYIRKNYKKRR